MKLRVEQVAGPAFVRYAISCENGLWWSNDAWSPDKKRAALYAKLAVARDDWKKLQAEMETGLTVLTVNVVVTIKAANELTPEQIEELKWYLSSGSTFLLDYSKPRPDWLTNSVVSSKIIWGSLRKK